MRTSSPFLVAAFALLLGGCEDTVDARDDAASGDSDGGIINQPVGCPYAVTLPGETSLYTTDDGTAPIGAPTALHLSWYGDPMTTATVVWETTIANGTDTTGASVEFGAGDYSQKANGFSYAYSTDLAGTDPPSVRVHQVHLCGLTPGTAYQYRIAGMASGGSFATAPGPGKPFRFAVGGDSRGNAMQWGQDLAGLSTAGVEFLLYTGDAVDLGTIQPAWDSWLAAGATILPSLPMMTANGNHEDNARHYYAQFALPGVAEWYDFDYGDVHFVVLNSSPVVDTTIENEQKSFLDASLAASKRKWNVVMFHKGVYSSSVHGSAGEGERFQTAWVPVFDKYHVDAVFNGHDHDYERTKSMKGGVPVADGAGTTYIVNGGGGADSYAAAISDFTAFSQSTFGYNLVDVTDGKMTITAYSVGGGGAPTQIDQVVLSK